MTITVTIQSNEKQGTGRSMVVLTNLALISKHRCGVRGFATKHDTF